jgi:aminoglycoside phosphotransferase (APT) family kinase protein
MSRKNMFYWQSDRPYTVEEIKTIFLDRKSDYSTSDLKLAAERAIKEEVVLHDPINHGSVNIVCPFTSLSGKEYVIRAHPKQVKNEYFYAESEVMKLASSVGVPVPQTILVDDTRSVVPFDYMVSTKINGQVMKVVVQADPALHPTYLKQIGYYLGLLHKVKTQGFGFFDNEKAKEGELLGIYNNNIDHYLAALDSDEAFHNDNKSHLDPSMVKKAIHVLKNKIDLATCENPTVVHNDIADWNTVVDGDMVSGIMDWDESFSGDPVFDFATTSLFYSDEQMEHLKTGYLETNVLPENYQEKYNLYVIRYVINKSKIAIKQLNSRQNDFMKLWLANAITKLDSAIQYFK